MLQEWAQKLTGQTPSAGRDRIHESLNFHSSALQFRHKSAPYVLRIVEQDINQLGYCAGEGGIVIYQYP